MRTLLLLIFLMPTLRAQPAPYPVRETSIAQLREAIRSHRVTCRQLVEAYIARINALDQSSKPHPLNAIILINPQALADADALDAEYARTGKLRPLHGIPLIIKDNYDTAGLQTTGGSLALKHFEPTEDAFMVKKLRAAGAIILAKSNMAEWAFSPYLTASSIAGITRNPYALDRVPAGSSGGTAAAVAASLGAAGLGTDTGNSIRGPSSHNMLVGIRPTIGLTSRDGIIPLFAHNDVGGPMARSVADAAAILTVVAGADPADPVTALAPKTPIDYTAYLKKDGLRGARIGVFRPYRRRPKDRPADQGPCRASHRRTLRPRAPSSSTPSSSPTTSRSPRTSGAATSRPTSTPGSPSTRRTHNFTRSPRSSPPASTFPILKKI